MYNKKILDCLEHNIDGLSNLQYFMKYPDELTYNDLMLEINIDHLHGYECLLPVMLLASDDPVIERTCKRLLLQLYREKLQELGGRTIVDRIADVLKEEKRKWDKRTKRLLELKEQNKL